MTSSIIYKASLSIGYPNEITMPIGSEILHIADQHGKLTMWYRFWQTQFLEETRRFEVYGTGQDIPDSQMLRYVGSALQFEGSLVWHVFERSVARVD